MCIYIYIYIYIYIDVNQTQVQSDVDKIISSRNILADDSWYSISMYISYYLGEYIYMFLLV